MPVSKRSAAASPSEPPDNLRAYLFMGIDLSVRGTQANGDCPFCGAAGKFTVHLATGQWRCWVCGGGRPSGGGNALEFLRTLHAAVALAGQDGFAAEVAADRRLCYAETPQAWGVARSPVPPYPWLVPGYGADGKLNQLYKRVWMGGQRDGSWRLLPTPDIGWTEGKSHALHMPVGDFDPECPNVYICEGPWDGMALWEVARGSSIAPCQILAVPGCNVWQDAWTQFCKGKCVTLMYDSDHPRAPVRNGPTFRPGYDGMYRVAKKLSGVAASVRWLRWGQDGYDPNRPNGWDIRDHLSGAPARPLLMVDRREALTDLISKIQDVPTEWFSATAVSANGNGRAHSNSIEPIRCHTWVECLDAWREAMHWRREMSDALSVLLAVCASTQQSGNQLFLQLVGSAGSGKTTMCEGLLVSHHCHHLEHLTGFHSGWKSEANNDGSKKDCSLIARVNGKTLVTPEADIMISSPRFTEIMSQQRRIFDGKSGATYKNSSEDTLYEGLRTPWIMAGTQALMDTDQSRLGDRFLRIIINDPGEDEKRAILRSALRSERTAMMDQANGTAGSIVDPKTRRAYALTGGYVDWLRANIESLIPSVRIPPEAEDRCIDLAELSADLRARPNEDKRKKETHDCKELPTRLTRQNVRLAAHLAVVLNKQSVDNEVMGIVRKVALDTAYGHSLNVVGWLSSVNRHGDGRTYQEYGGLPTKTLENWLGMPEERALNYLLFLRKIDVLTMKTTPQKGSMWLLTNRVYELYSRVMRD